MRNTVEGEKNIPQLIVGALMSGEPLRAREISDLISKEAGKEIKIQDFSSLLSKISDKNKCDLGYFVNRTKEGSSYVYRVIDEALNLTEEQAYGLTLKVGKDKYSLEQAVQDYPELERYISKRAFSQAGRARRKASKTSNVQKRTARIEKAVEPVTKQQGSSSEEKAASELADSMAEWLQTKLSGSKGFNININVTVKVSGE